MDFALHDLAVIGTLFFLEGILSLDNALVLAVLARGVKPELQQRALTYGLIGAVVFRMLAIGFASALIEYRWIKFVGGGYLLWLAFKYFFLDTEEEHTREVKVRSFWKTIVVIELTDIAFAVDSILAAVAMTNKYWLIVTGGLLGTFAMRFVANGLISFLKKYPNLENTAYLLIFVIGGKVIIEGLSLPGVDFHDYSKPYFWIQWGLMAVMIAYGFLPGKSKEK